MAADGSIVIDTKIDDSNLKKDLKNITGNIKKAMQGIQKATTLAIGSVGALTAAFGAASVKFARTTDRIDKMSQRLTLSREAFQEWDFILSQSGVSIDSLQMSMKTLTQEIERDSDAFAKLGVSSKDAVGNFRNQEEVFKDTIIALQGMEAGIEKSSLAQKLFGRNGQELLPLLNAQAGSVEELTQKARDLGLVMSDEVIDAGVLLTDQMDQIKRSISNVLTVAFLPLAQATNDIIKDLVDWAIANKGIEKSIESITKAMNFAREVWIKTVGVFKSGLVTISEFFKVTGLGIEEVFTKSITSIQLFFNKIISSSSMAGMQLKTSFVLAVNTIKIAVVELTQVIIDKLLGGVQALLDLFSKLPFVGDMFAGLSSSVGNLRNGLEETKKTAINSSVEMSQLAINQRAEFVKTEKARVKALENEKMAKIKALEEEKRLTKEQADAERKVIEEATQARLDALELIEIETHKFQEKQIEATASTGASVVTGYSVALYKGLPKVQQFFKDMKGVILKSLQGITAGGVGQALKQASLFIGDVFIKGLSNVVTYARKFSGMFFETISYLSDFSTTTILENLDKTLKGLEDFFFEGGELYNISNMFNAAISWIQDFVDGLEQNKELIFTEMGNIFTSLSTQISENTELFTAIGRIIGETISVIAENLPQFVTAGLTVVESIASGILENIDIIIESAIDVVSSVIGYIADNSGSFLQAGFDILMAIVQGIIDNMDSIVESVVTIISTIITFIGENIGDLIGAGIEMVTAIAIGIVENADEIIKALIGIIPDLILAIIEAIPDIVSAFIEMIPALVVALVEATPEIIAAIGNLVVEMIQGFGDFIASAPGIMGDFFKGLIQGLKDGWKEFTEVFSSLGQEVQLVTNPGGGLPTSSGGSTIPTLSQTQFPTQAFNSIVSGLSSGISQPSVISQAATPIVLNANMMGSVELDGREIGRVSYQYVDEYVGGSYGS